MVQDQKTQNISQPIISETQNNDQVLFAVDNLNDLHLDHNLVFYYLRMTGRLRFSGANRLPR